MSIAPFFRLPLAASPVRTAAASAMLAMALSASADIVINEIDPATQRFESAVNFDALEFIELYNPSASPQSLDGYVLVLYAGYDRKSYDAIDLSGRSIPAGGYFVVGSPNTPNVNLVKPAPSNNFGIWFRIDTLRGNGVALFKGKSVADFPNGSPLPGNATDTVDAVVHGVNLVDSDFVAALTPGQQAPIEGPGASSLLYSLGRKTDGAPLASPVRNTTEWARLIPSPGRSNIGNLESATPPATQRIGVVVGDGSAMASAAENGSAFNLNVTVSRSAATAQAVTVTLASLDPSEFVFSSPSAPTITIPAGQVSATASVAVLPVDDLWLDGDQTVYFTATPSDPAYQTGVGWLRIADSETGASAAPSLVINEVNGNAWSGALPVGDPNGDGSRNSGDDFVEIVNTGATPADLTGYKLESLDGRWITFPAGTVLKSGQALVVFSQVAVDKIGTTVSFGEALVQASESPAKSLHDGGDVVRLLNASNQEIAGHVFAPWQVGSDTRQADPTPGNPSSFHPLLPIYLPEDPGSVNDSLAGNGHGLVAPNGALTSPGARLNASPFVQAGVITLTFGRGQNAAFVPSPNFSELENVDKAVLRVSLSIPVPSNWPVKLILSDSTVATFDDHSVDRLFTVPSGADTIYIPLLLHSDATNVQDRHRTIGIAAFSSAYVNTSGSAEIFDDTLQITPALDVVSELEGATSATITRPFGRTETIDFDAHFIGLIDIRPGDGLTASGTKDIPLVLTGANPLTVPITLECNATPDDPDRTFTLTLSSRDTTPRTLNTSPSVTVLDDYFKFKASDNPVSELEGSMSVTLERKSGVMRPLNVALTLAPTGAGTLPALFTENSTPATSRSLSTANGNVSGGPAIPLTLLCDEVRDNPDRPFTVSATVCGQVFTSAAITVLDDYVTFATPTAAAVSELEGTLPMVLNRRSGRTRTIHVDLSIAPTGGSAASAQFANGTGLFSFDLADSTPVDLPLTLLCDNVPMSPARTFVLNATSCSKSFGPSAEITVLDDYLTITAPSRTDYSELEASGPVLTLHRPSMVVRPIAVTVALQAIAPKTAKALLTGSGLSNGGLSRTLNLVDASDIPLPTAFVCDDQHIGGPDGAFRLVPNSCGLAFAVSPTVDVANDYFVVLPSAAATFDCLSKAPQIELQRAPGRQETVSVTVNLVPEAGSAAVANFVSTGTATATVTAGPLAPAPLPVRFDWFSGADRSFKAAATSCGQSQIPSGVLTVKGVTAGLLAWATRWNLTALDRGEVLTDDKDGDGVTGLFEYVAGLDPTQASSRPQLLIEVVPANPNPPATPQTLRLTYPLGVEAAADAALSAHWKASQTLVSGSWSDLGAATTLPPVTDRWTLEIPNAPLDGGRPDRFYRLDVQLTCP